METFNYITVTRKILADLYTPVGIYMHLRDKYPQSALMESSDYHSHDNSRSFIGIHPIASIMIGHGAVNCSFPDGTTETERLPIFTQKGADTCKLAVANAMNRFLKRFHVEGERKDLCGLYGYTAFNAVRYFENIPIKDEIIEKNDAPDIYYILYQNLIVFDHFNNTIELITLSDSDSEKGEIELDKLIKSIDCANVKPYGFRPIGETISTLTDEQHKANIRKCVQHCLRGDVFQIVVSRRFIQRYEGDDFKLYRVLRSINPSPYLFYLDFGGFRIFGSSPETHNRMMGNQSFIDPIAGTTRRTGNQEQDQKNASFLANDSKENAEHVMLVDLARNDLSRNCHDVKVDFYKDMQLYSHVIHLVSRVSGVLDEGADHISAFIDTFPAGTLSGAPKVKAMQIISELEPHSRGVYGGCIGFIGLNGDLNQAIVIRTFVSRNGELWFQAGSGVVSKSDADYELEECNNKLGALAQAIKIAENI
ncbi:chorismate binding enzyme [Prevotella sp. DNF00663]|uniref:anthranilate synthase component I family protein n=1 Tax=unclassified Prevotella TaxID=2638335 RepID=UPI000514313B|nr:MULTISPECIES: anthranilate synthase component I family protein [unclassified Prevotella]KGI60245.1 anthranilate synthase subunit I [Prevotella sp. S7 MS 2]KXB84590.1 chorismate binding enzyme [Prevotella sp. DNF00663]